MHRCLARESGDSPSSRATAPRAAHPRAATLTTLTASMGCPAKRLSQATRSALTPRPQHQRDLHAHRRRSGAPSRANFHPGAGLVVFGHAIGAKQKQQADVQYMREAGLPRRRLSRMRWWPSQQPRRGYGHTYARRRKKGSRAAPKCSDDDIIGLTLEGGA